MRCLILCLLLFPFTLLASDTTLVWQKILKSFKTTEINPAKLKPTVERKVINELQVIDLRPDKDRLGMYSNDLFHPHQSLLTDNKKLEALLIEKLVDDKASDH